MTEEEKNQLFDSIITKVTQGFTSDTYNTTKLDEGEDEIIEISNVKIILTTTKNLKNNENNNMTTIDLKECETLIKNAYNISLNESLYMKILGVQQESMKISKTEFDVYSKLNGTNLISLNLSICKDSRISLSVPVDINEDLDKLNSSSAYFNDRCYSTTSDSGTDIILKDRQTEFVEGNKTVCQENCDFSSYNKTTKTADCSCQVQESSSSIANMTINKDKLYENFGDKGNKKEVSNLGVTSCNVLSSKKNIISNPGFYILLIILIIFVIISIIFCTKGYILIENKFDEVIYNKFEKANKKKIVKKKVLKKKIRKFHNPTKKSLRSKNKNLSSTIKSSFTTQSFFKKRPNKKVNSNNLRANLTNTKRNNIQISNIRIMKPETDYEYNWLSYEEALIFDKRTNCEYYCSLLRSKQLFIFTFCSFNDYNSRIIKRFIFFLLFALHYSVNALFFNDSNLHQIYEDEGSYNFVYQISYTLYSALIATFMVRFMLHFLILTDKDVLEVKLKATQNLAINLKKQKLKCIKIKFAIFFILNFVLLGLFWYYLTCFNAIYKNTQIYLIENTFISFGFSLFYPFIINIFPMMMRMCSIHSSNKDQKCFYKTSQILQLI